MSARDIYHDTVKRALEKDGWKITDDPLHLRYRTVNTYVDLGAERLLAAQKGSEQIAVEIKSFLSNSVVHDLENAVGQFFLYEELLRRLEPNRVLYLAVSKAVYLNVFVEAIGDVFLDSQSQQVRLLVFDAREEVIVEWIN